MPSLSLRFTVGGSAITPIADNPVRLAFIRSKIENPDIDIDFDALKAKLTEDNLLFYSLGDFRLTPIEIPKIVQQINEMDIPASP